MTNPNTIIFLHIPKTAGTTLNRILQKQFRPQQIYNLGANVQESLRVYRGMTTGERSAYRLVTGHTSYGFHDYVPGSSTYFTFLRDPVERVISFYHFVKSNDQHYLNNAVINEYSGITPFINSGITKMVDNGQTRLISGVWLEPGYGEITAQTFEQAKRNLAQNFSVVGLTEQFDATLLLLRKRFNWKDIFYVRQNVSKVGARDRELTAEENDVISNYNRWDIALYEFVQELFEQQITDLGPDFPRQLATFRSRNKRYQTYKAPLLQTAQRLRRFSIRASIRRALARDNGK